MIRDINLALDGASVKRWHTHRMQRQQTVAEHTFRAVLILLAIWPDCRPELIRALMFHDLSEVKTGDVPANVKWDNPDLDVALKALEGKLDAANGYTEVLTANEAHALKWCDSVELLSWSHEETKLGNDYAFKPLNGIYEKIREMDLPKDNNDVTLPNAQYVLMQFID